MSMRNRIGLSVTALGLVALFSLQGKNDNDATLNNEQPDTTSSAPEATTEAPTIDPKDTKWLITPIQTTDADGDQPIYLDAGDTLLEYQDEGLGIDTTVPPYQTSKSSGISITDGDGDYMNPAIINIEIEPSTPFEKKLAEILDTMTPKEQRRFLNILINQLENEVELEMGGTSNDVTREQILDQYPHLDM